MNTAECEQIVRQIGNQGFAIIPDVFSAGDVQRLRNAFEEILAAEGAPAGDAQPRFSYNLSNKHATFREMVQHPLLMDLVAALLGADFILAALNAHGSTPGTARQQLHRDEILDRRIPFPTHINSMWMLDDFTAENGATRVVPGSHLWIEGPQPDKVYAQERQATGAAGSVAVFDGRLFHARGGNRTSRARRGVTAYFGQAWTKPQEDHTRSVDPAIVAGASPLLIRLWGFHNQVPWEEASTPNILRRIPAPGVAAVAAG